MNRHLLVNRHARLSLLLLLFVPLLLQAGDKTENAGAVWTELGVSKSLPYNLSVDAELEYRTLDWFKESNRYNVGIGLGYKLNKYLKFGVGYTFIQKHYLEEVEDHYSDKGNYNGYNVTAPFWIPRHRMAFDVMASKRLWKTLRIGVRERYQYTHQASKEISRIKYRKAFDAETGEDIYVPKSDDWEDNFKIKKAKNVHLLRSRLKLSIDRKGWKWEPYISVEAHNNLGEQWHLDKVRTAAGVEYSVAKGHKLGLGYIFNHENDDDGNYNIHAVSIGYKYSF